MDLSKYLPNYPEFDVRNSRETLSILGKRDDISPYLSISRKNEFYETKLESEEKRPERPGEWTKHQIFMSRFISGYTPYSNILLMHEPGTGKTCTSVAVIESIRKYCKDINGALVLMTGDALIQNYKNEIVNVCTSGTYLPKNYSKLNKRQRQIRIKKNLDVFYEFQTYDKFSSLLQDEWNVEFVKNTYSNKVIVLDEVHNLRQHDPNLKYQWSELKKKPNLSIDEKQIFDILNPKYSSEKPELVKIPSQSLNFIYSLLSLKRYTNIYQFLHIVTNCKILLLSGTPMRDQPDEIVDIMNLILPETLRLTAETYFNNHVLIPEQIGLFKEALKGRVSYLKAMKSNVRKEYQRNAEFPIDLSNLTLYGLKMSAFQTKVYSMAKQVDLERQGIYSFSRQANLFVLDNETYGREAYQHVIQGYDLRHLLTENTSQLAGKAKTDKMISNLYQYSCKYAECIKKIFEFPDQSHFVYTEFVRGSGANIFKKILDLFSFEQAKIFVRDDVQPAYVDDDDDDDDEGEEKKDENDEIDVILSRMKERKRYAILTGDTSKEISLLTKVFSHNDNKDGKYIQIVIGSSIVSEGFTLKNVQNVHILTPDWNFSTLDQVIARSHRLFSHDALTASYPDRDIYVKIYLYCAVPDNCGADLNECSIDYRMFSGSQQKDRNIKAVERVLKEVSVDCYLNKERNQSRFPAIENRTRECEYQECEYQCDGIPLNVTFGGDDGISNRLKNQFSIDYSTYNLYYDEKEISKITNDIITLFSKQTKIRLVDVLQKIKHNELSILKAIYQMIIMNTVIIDRLGNYCFLRSEHDYLYLTYKADHKSVFFDQYYIEHFPLYEFKEVSYFKEYVRRMIEEFKSTNDVKKLLPEIQEMVLEQCFEDEKGDEKDRIKTLFSGRFDILDDQTIVSRVLERIRCKPRDGVWQYCVHDEHKKIENFIVPNQWDIVGQIRDDEFFIFYPSLYAKAKDRRQRPTGLKCGTGSLQKQGLVQLFVTLCIPMDDLDHGEVYTESSPEIEERSRQVLENYGTRRDKQPGDKEGCFRMIQELYNKDHKQGNESNINDHIRYLYWKKMKGDVFCEKLKEWLSRKNLLFDENGKHI